MASFLDSFCKYNRACVFLHNTPNPAFLRRRISARLERPNYGGHKSCVQGKGYYPLSFISRLGRCAFSHFRQSRTCIRRRVFSSRNTANREKTCTWHSGGECAFHASVHRDIAQPWKITVTRQSFRRAISPSVGNKNSCFHCWRGDRSSLPPVPATDVYITAACLISASNRADRRKEEGKLAVAEICLSRLFLVERYPEIWSS